MFFEILITVLVLLNIWQVHKLKRWVFHLVKEVLYDKYDKEVSSKPDNRG